MLTWLDAKTCIEMERITVISVHSQIHAHRFFSPTMWLVLAYDNTRSRHLMMFLFNPIAGWGQSHLRSFYAKLICPTLICACSLREISISRTNQVNGVEDSNTTQSPHPPPSIPSPVPSCPSLNTHLQNMQCSQNPNLIDLIS